MGLGAAQERAHDRYSPRRLGHDGPPHIGRVNPTARWPHNRGRKGISQSHLHRASSAPAGTERTCCPPGRRGLLNCGLHLICGVSLWGPRRTLPRSKRRGSWLSPGPPPPLSSSTEGHNALKPRPAQLHLLFMGTQQLQQVPSSLHPPQGPPSRTREPGDWGGLPRGGLYS